MYYMNVSFFFIENYEETGRRVHCGPLNHFCFFLEGIENVVVARIIQVGSCYGI